MPILLFSMTDPGVHLGPKRACQRAGDAPSGPSASNPPPFPPILDIKPPPARPPREPVPIIPTPSTEQGPSPRRRPPPPFELAVPPSVPKQAAPEGTPRPTQTPPPGTIPPLQPRAGQQMDSRLKWSQGKPGVSIFTDEKSNRWAFKETIHEPPYTWVLERSSPARIIRLSPTLREAKAIYREAQNLHSPRELGGALQ
jgi:hypothetical protein